MPIQNAGPGMTALGRGGGLDPYAAYRIYDSFTDTTGTALASHTPEKGGPWVVSAAGFTIQSNKLQNTAGGSIYAQADAGTGTQTVTADIMFPADGSAVGLIVRGDGGGNHWVLYLDRAGGSSFYAIFEAAGGAYTQRALGSTSALSLGVTYSLGFSAIGTTLTGTINGGSSFGYTSALYQAQTQAGLYTNVAGGQTMDNLTVI